MRDLLWTRRDLFSSCRPLAGPVTRVCWPTRHRQRRFRALVRPFTQRSPLTRRFSSRRADPCGRSADPSGRSLNPDDGRAGTKPRRANVIGRSVDDVVHSVRVNLRRDTSIERSRGSHLRAVTFSDRLTGNSDPHGEGFRCVDTDFRRRAYSSGTGD
jgi:hypothetical protein